jgi:hypothetical protein
MKITELRANSSVLQLHRVLRTSLTRTVGLRRVVSSSEFSQATVSINRRAPVYFGSTGSTYKYVEISEISLRYSTLHANIAPMTY